MTRQMRAIATAACVAVLGSAATGCGSAPAARPTSTAGTVPAVALNTSITTAAGTWATVVMGGSAAQHNNFWQVFIRPAGATRWKLVTPPGTADNGGLILAPGAGLSLVTAFRPSQYLTYTPLTQTGNAGDAWSALSPLDAALASTPDSLAIQPGSGRLLALLSSGVADAGAPGAASWTTLVSTRTLAASPAGRSCGLQGLTAVAYTPAGTPLLAGTCSHPGAAGIFALIHQSWSSTGPVLTGSLAHQPITVLRLDTSASQTTALLAAGTGQRTSLLAAWSTDGGASWTLSPPLRTGGAVAGASFGPGQAAAVITGSGLGAVLVAGGWQQLPALPSGTLALAPGSSGTTDALAVHRAILTVWQLADGQHSWSSEQTISVPIQYGSSG